MKKLIITAAVAACAAVVTAQTVTSANIVGYNKAINQTGLQILGTQFEMATATPDSLFGSTLPYGSKVYVFNAPNGPYTIATYNKGFFGLPDSWDSAPDLSAGKGYWVQLPSNTVENVIAGEVNMSDAVTNSIVVGLQLLSNPYPTELTVKTAGFTPAYGDKVYVFNAPNGPYTIATYNKGFFGLPDDWDSDPVIPVGVGFWYESQSNAVDWVVNRPFTP